MSAADLKLAEYDSLFLGPLLGEGISRRVYVNKNDPTTVIKFENKPGSFQNINEWETWRYLQWHPVAKLWLAPCLRISSCGTMLIQKRAKPLSDDYKLPDKVPRFITDCKRQNFGLIGKRFVAVDYGYTLNNYETKLRKQTWDTADS